MWYIYSMEYCAAVRNEKIIQLTATWLEKEDTMLNGVRRETNTGYSYISVVYRVIG